MVMHKPLQLATALAALLATPALAQSTTPAPTPPAAQQAAPAPQAGGGATPASPTTAPSTAAAPGPSSPLAFVDAQQPEETLASDLMGTQVYNAENQALGEINDVLLGADGRLKAVVVGVGGFLGLGERDVAVPWEALQVSREEGQDLVLRLKVGREQLEQAPAFTTMAEREAAERAAQAARTPPVTGAAPGTPAGGVGAGGAAAPAPVPGAAPNTPAQ
jgi:sporulation protein YlmC with PRC-barrel domain